MPNDQKNLSNEGQCSRNSDVSSSACPGQHTTRPRVKSSGVVTPPDGGWGWMVVIASFMAHLIADGCSLSFGVLFAELLEAFEESKSKTAWVGSLFISMPLICGPFASMIVSCYGCRWATMVGGLLAALGCISSAFVNSIDMLCITFGVLSGFGLSLVFIPAVLVVAFYFDQRRSLATGIAVAGSGIGTFIFAPLTELLIEEFSWRGALIIIGGLMLNLVVAGAIFRPLPGLCLTAKPVILDSKNTDFVVSNRVSFLSSRGSLEEVEDEQDNDPFSDCNGLRLPVLSHVPKPLTRSLILLPTYFNGNIYVPEPDLLQLMQVRDNRLLSEGHDDLRADNQLVNFQCPSYCVISFDSGVIAMDNGSSDRDDRNITVTVDDVEEETDTNKIVLASAVLNNSSFVLTGPLLRFCRNDVFCRHGLRQDRFLLARGQLSSCPNIYLHAREERNLRGLLFSRWLVHLLRKTFDLSIFRSAIFNYFCLHSMLLYMSYNNPYIYLPDKAAQHGIPADHASTLVAIIGISSTVGQVVMGFIGDQPKVDTVLFYSVMTSIAGVITLLVPLFTTFSFLALYSASYGFFISANYALTSIILVDLLGLQQLTSSFGVVSSAGGLAVLFGPPLAGWVSDQTGSYESSFYISGIIILVSGCMLFAVPCLRRRNSSATANEKVASNKTATSNTSSSCECSLSRGQDAVSKVST